MDKTGSATRALEKKNGFTLEGAWNQQDLSLLEIVLRDFAQINPGFVFGTQKLKLIIKLDRTRGNCLLTPGKICLNPNGLTIWTIAHELAHAWDAAHQWQLSKWMHKETSSGFISQTLHRWFPEWKLFWYRVGNPPAPCGVDKYFNAREDFAEAVTAYIYPEEADKRASQRGYAYQLWGFTHFHDTPRGRFIRELLAREKTEIVNPARVKSKPIRISKGR
jgi:hypothetical protein